MVTMVFRRSIPRDARLSAREVRTLRRLEDATADEDSLLDDRFGRRSKAIGAQLAHEAIGALVIASLLAIAVALFVTQSLAIGLLILLPSAFVFGLAVSRPPRLRATTATFERASYVGQPPPSHVQ